MHEVVSRDSIIRFDGGCQVGDKAGLKILKKSEKVISRELASQLARKEETEFASMPTSHIVKTLTKKQMRPIKGKLSWSGHFNCPACGIGIHFRIDKND